jgi:adenosine deaminase
VLEESAASGVVYSETFLSPDFCGGRDLGAWREYLHAIEEAAAQAERQMGITLRGIVTCIRHFGPDKARQTALCAAETAGEFIVGFGIAGDEKVGKPKDFLVLRPCARGGAAADRPCGRMGRARKRARCAADLRPERIGHGVRAIEDMALVDQLAETGVVLEVCPGSNIALGLYSRLAQASHRRAVRRG